MYCDQQQKEKKTEKKLIMQSSNSIKPGLLLNARVVSHFIHNNFNHGNIVYFLLQSNSKFCYNVEITWASYNHFCAM